MTGPTHLRLPQEQKLGGTTRLVLQDRGLQGQRHFPRTLCRSERPSRTTFLNCKKVVIKRAKLIPVRPAIAFATFLVWFSVLTLHAQQTGEIKRTVLEKKDLSVPGREGLLVLVEFTPGAREAKHIHPDDLFAYLKEGNLTLNREGMPAVTLTPGEVFFVPEKVHWGECAEKMPCKVLVTFIVEKGKPLSSPAK